MLTVGLQLNAKWLLENQLEQNRARRAYEAAQTEVVANKRKLEDAADKTPVDPQAPQMEENPAKRIKVQHSPRDTALWPEEIHEVSTEDAHISDDTQNAVKNDRDVNELDMSTAQETAPESKEIDTKESAAPVGVQAKTSEDRGQTSHVQAAAPPPQVLTEAKEQPYQTVSDGDMNFESMFGDANMGNDQNNDMNFDLDLNSNNLGVPNPFDAVTNTASNLELLPGLESYANASGDDFNMLNLPPSTTGVQAGTGGAVNNNFDLGEIQGDTHFNDLFADGDFGGDASLMDLDLEDGFF